MTVSPDPPPPVTTPVDPRVLATPAAGFDPRPGSPKNVVIVGPGSPAWSPRSS